MIKINPIQTNDLGLVTTFLREVITDTFRSEGLVGDTYEQIIDSEIAMQANRLQLCLTDPTRNQMFVAFDENQIVATGGYTTVGDTVTKTLEFADLTFENLCEVDCFYVKPNYQKQGIGRMLFTKTIEALELTNYKHFALSSGYDKGKAFWKKQLGEPTIVMPKYFEGSIDCHVWVKKL